MRSHTILWVPWRVPMCDFIYANKLGFTWLLVDYVLGFPSLIFPWLMRLTSWTLTACCTMFFMSLRLKRTQYINSNYLREYTHVRWSFHLLQSLAAAARQFLTQVTGCSGRSEAWWPILENFPSLLFNWSSHTYISSTRSLPPISKIKHPI
jgi:hypothetical protein